MCWTWSVHQRWCCQNWITNYHRRLLLETLSGLLFSARCNIYILRLCYDASVRLSVTFVHCGHRVQWILNTFACLDRWMSLLLTDNASPRSLDGMMPGFLVEEGGIEKLVIVAISLNLLTESLASCDIFAIVYIWTMLIFNLIYNLMHYIWRTVCARASHVSRYASHCYALAHCSFVYH